jgi:hypothetical protein
MSSEKQIKITKKDKTSHIVPATQRATYEAFNAKSRKLRREKDVVEIEDYEEPEEKGSDTGSANTSTGSSTGDAGGKKTAVEVIALINAATTEEEVNKAAEGDTRVSVLKAAELKVAELTK